MAAADRAPGLIARSGYVSDGDASSWGREVYPRFHVARGDGWSPATLSLWTDIEAPFAFSYSGLHRQAMRRGPMWFRAGKWPPLVLWWHKGAGHPVWAQGARRLEHLHDHGASPEAFTFRAPYDAAGASTRLDQARIRSLRR